MLVLIQYFLPLLHFQNPVGLEFFVFGGPSTRSLVWPSGSPRRTVILIIKFFVWRCMYIRWIKKNLCLYVYVYVYVISVLYSGDSGFVASWSQLYAHILSFKNFSYLYKQPVQCYFIRQVHISLLYTKCTVQDLTMS